MKKKLLICDDHVMFAEMLVELVNNNDNLQVVSCTNEPAKLPELLANHHPDILLTDLYIPNTDMIAELTKILTVKPTQWVVVMSGMLNEVNMAKLFQLGVRGVVNKVGSTREILSAIEKVIAGERVFPPEILAKLQAGEVVAPKISKREIEVMLLISRGLSEKQIAGDLGISENTVNNHKQNIFAKLGVQNQVAMVVEGIKLGLIPNPLDFPAKK